MFRKVLTGLAVVALLASTSQAFPRRVLFEEYTGQS